MQINSEYIWIVVSIGGGILSREVWLHVQIARLSKDISWIKRLIDINFNKGGEE